MTREAFAELCASGAVILDGATGSNLRAAGLPVGVCVEAWVLKHPQVLIRLQRDYIAAGSQIIYAPTFGANRINLARYNLEDRADDMNRRLVAISKSAAEGSSVLVAGDITTTGKRLDAGEISYDELMDVYRSQAGILLEAGVDLFAVETMLGVDECSAAIEAIREICDLPIICTLTLDGTGKAYFDGDADQVAEQLPQLGADAVGINCGQGPSLYANVVSRMAKAAGVPIVCKPNAGMPQIMEDGSARYDLTPEDFAGQMLEIRNAGASLLGGCCGTTPEYIRALRKAII